MMTDTRFDSSVEEICRNRRPNHPTRREDMVLEAEANLKEIEKGIAAIHEPDEVIELRAIGEYGTATGYYNDLLKLARDIKRLSDSREFDGVYTTLNPCDRALLARRKPNVVHERVKGTTTNQEIIRRRWLPLDFDFQRPSGTSSTHREKTMVRWCALTAQAELQQMGWPEPVFADSGNGYHLDYPIDLPNDGDAEKLIKNVLLAICSRFSVTDPDDSSKNLVQVDTAVGNAARIIRAYGSVSRKGEDTEERPHRVSRILSVPKTLVTVTRQQLEALVTTLTDGRNKKAEESNQAAPGVTHADVEGFLERASLEVKSVTDTAEGGKRWTLAACPFNPEHTNAPAVFLSRDGKLGYHCFHESCRDNRWKQFRVAIEAKTGEKFYCAWGNGTMPYEATPSGIVLHNVTKDGQHTAVPLTNFRARIVTDLQEDDGVEPKHVFEIEAGLNGRKRTFVLPASQFLAMNWPIEKLGGEAIVMPGFGRRDHARAAIQYLSGNIERRRLFTHTGWRKVGGEWRYLHGGGAIGRKGLDGSFAVKLPPNLAPFLLPAPPGGGRLKVAVRASLRFLDSAPLRLTVPIFAAVWRSVLDVSDHSHHLSGPTNEFKTSVAALAMQHFGAGFDSRHLPGTWNSTANANAAMQFVLKDALCVIDDFVARGNRSDIERLHRDADRIFRGQGNIAGRGRMGRDLSLRDPNPPRGLTLSTGEEIPRGESLRTRVWVHEFSKGDVDKEKLTACQRDAGAGLYAETMAAYLQFLAPRYASLKKHLPRLIEDYRMKATRSGQHARTPEIVANLMLGMIYFLLFAEKSGALSKGEAKKIRVQAWRALGQAAEEQTRVQGAAEPAGRFLALIGAAIMSGVACLGDTRTCLADEDKRGRLIGWWSPNKTYVLLDPENAYAAANRLAQEQGEALAVDRNTLWRRLKDKGLLARYDKDRTLRCWRIANQRRRVLCVSKNDVLPSLPQKLPRFSEAD